MNNPYASSALDPVAISRGEGLSPRVLSALAGTRPWVRFCAIIGFILAGLIFILAAVMLFGGAALFASGGENAIGGSLPVIAALVYAVMGLLYLFPSIKLWKYGSHIASLMGSQSMSDLEAALESQRSFWKFVGVMVLVAICLYVLIFVVGMFVAIAGTAMTR